MFSPYRDLTNPILEVIDELDAERPDDVITVVIPEFVVEHWWDQALHNQSAVDAALEAASAPEHGDHADPRADRPPQARRTATAPPKQAVPEVAT